MDNLTKSQRWFQNHKEQQRACVQTRRKKIHEWYFALKATLVCSKCGENHPACLEFHHRDSKEKEVGIAICVRQGWSQKRILEEMAKCDVLCSNCHRKHHWSLSVSEFA